ncbi:SNARE-like superfamily protein [Raphanus sativus]|nr:SNARE-like superfamily protein [Raphanus sativus]
MGLINNTVHYCCVSRDNQILYAYNGGDQSNESLAGKRRFGFLIGDGFVYFAIVDEALGKLSVLKFLEHLRDEFKKAARKGSFTAVIGSVNVDDVVSKLIASLERVAAAETANNNSNLAEQSEAVSSSTKAPLLGKSSKQEKKRGRERSCRVG